MRTLLCIAAAGTLLVWAGCQTETSVDALVDEMGTIDYNYHVKPILSENCYACHGPDAEAREADLRLDTAEGAFALREDTLAAVVPHDPLASMLVHRINLDDPAEIMPPPESHKTLTDLEKAVLERWIAQGAEFKKHWAFIPPAKPDLPQGAAAIDEVIVRTASLQGLTLTEEADRRTLIRRLSYDLTGLPPDIEDIRAFLEDESPDAYEKVVDRLLTSSQFGERMAVPWLDQARYSDTNGYSIDGGRHMWIWRDWVIKAFNENKPYDEFVIEQLAGDLLPEPTEEQRIATGFNRNHMNTHEGGTIPEENLVNYVADRVRTTSEVFMGLTMACAQCHDHKFDPISQRDYYQFFAFFNTISDKSNDGDRGINSVPAIDVKTPLIDESEIAELKARLVELEGQEDRYHDAQEKWEQRERSLLAERGRDLALHTMAPTKVTTPNTGDFPQILEDSTLLVDKPFGLGAYNIVMETPDIAEPITGLRVEFLPNAMTNGRLGYGENDGIKDSFILTTALLSGGRQPANQVDLHGLIHYVKATATSEGPDWPVTDIFDDRRWSGWSPEAGVRTKQHLTLTFDEPVLARDVPHMTLLLNFGQGHKQVPGHIRVLAMTGADDGTNLPADVERLIASGPAERSSDEASRMRRYFVDVSPEMAPFRWEKGNVQDRLAVLTEPHSTMVMAEAEDPRETHILSRGQYDQKLEKVSPLTPSALPPLPDTTNVDRLSLAKWLVSEDHPLTARVAVNRLWQTIFGSGLVTTPGDFGAQGALPSHPELLDWLAVDLMENDWDMKRLVKMMVMSETYRRDSGSTEKALEADPTNVYLARGPRQRIQAEFLRDAALRVSGLLVDRLGGPSVKPYQPYGLWKEVSHYGSTGATAQSFVQDNGEKLYRRSMYTYWKRTAPPPSMMAFDAPNREVCTIDRAITNTPLQALVMLNDPQFVEASRAFAERIIRTTDDLDGRIDYAFESTTGRLPEDQERAIIRSRLEDELATFSDGDSDAVRFLGVGQSTADPDLASNELAAWTAVANMLFNLSESITKG